MSTGLKLIARERARQITQEGWSPSHDDRHRKGELDAAAQCYLVQSFLARKEPPAPAQWPWNSSWWKPGNRRRNLIKAGALFLAERDRLERRGFGKEAYAAHAMAIKCANQIDLFSKRKPSK